MIDRKTVDEICRRSALGEGVQHILADMKINVQEGLIYLRDNHSQDIRDAKLIQLDARGELTEKAKAENGQMLERAKSDEKSWHAEAIEQAQLAKKE